MADAKSIQEPVVKALAEYISSFQFQRTFEEFFLNNALKFTDEQEHQLDYMTIYLDFQTLFNQQMEDFLSKQNLTEDEFTDICQRAIKEDKRAENFLEIVIASMDYDAFFQLMKAMRGRAASESKGKRRQEDEDEDTDSKEYRSSAKEVDEKDEDDGKSDEK